MSFLGFLKDFIIRPGKAMEENVGRYTLIGFLIPFLSLFIGHIFLLLIIVGEVNFSFILALSISTIINIIISTLYIHIPAFFLTEDRKQPIRLWKNFISLYGFIYIFQIFGVLMITVITLLSTYNPIKNNTFILFNKGIMPVVIFLYVFISLIPLIYKALIVKSVYNFKWPTTILALIITFCLSSFIKIDIPFINVNQNITNTHIAYMPLMMEGIEEINVPASMEVSLFYQGDSELTKDSIVIVKPQKLHYRAIPYTREMTKSFLAYLAALPGDEIFLHEGILYVNGEEKYSPTVPVPHLSLKKRTLKDDEYFIYFDSPQALIVSTKAENFIVGSEDIHGTLTGNTFRLYKWLFSR